MTDTAADFADEQASPSGSRFGQRPASRLGRWALGLEAVFVAFFSLNMVGYWVQMAQDQLGLSQEVPDYVWLLVGATWVGFACALVGGVLGLVAMVRHRERSWVLWLSLVPALFALTFLLGEFLVPH